MTRRVRRDPRSLLELRRLAYRAQRSDAAREVLHDALLETFPVYERYLTDALERATSDERPYAVVFSPWPLALKRYRRTNPSVLFGIYSLDYVHAAQRIHARSRTRLEADNSPSFKYDVISYVTPRFVPTIEPGTKVYFTKGAASRHSSWKPGYYIVLGESRRGGSHLVDEDRVSEAGELSYVLAKSMRGGGLWALASNTRRVATRSRKGGSL